MAEKTIKLDIGTIYKKTPKSSYYFRYQINGQRKAISLHTRNQKEAITKAQELLPVVKATNTEVISAHVKHARGLTARKRPLLLADAWKIYSQHPDRAIPSTVSEQNAYNATLKEFVDYVDNDQIDLNDITPEITNRFANFLRSNEISVETHNRKIRRLKKIFEVLKEYRNNDNPFQANSLRRKMREEQNQIVKRQSFSREQETEILKVLSDDIHKVKNKSEIRVVYHIGMFTGQRLKDCVLLRWDCIDFDKNKIWVKQFKTGKEVTIPIAAELRTVLLEAQACKVNRYVSPKVAKRYNGVDKNGKNIGANLVDLDVLRVIKWVGLEAAVKISGRKKKVSVYGFHSLRHSFASHCAEAGVPKAVVLSILGTNSEIVDKYYTHIGEEAQEKAIQSLFGKNKTTSDRERIEKALIVIDGLKIKNKAIKEIEGILRTP